LTRGFSVIIRCTLIFGDATMIFHITLEQAEDGWIVAECPALPGCVSQGQDDKEAVDNIKEAIEAWLWAEDQKALSQWHPTSAKTPILVAV
jgi:predicted RNase H-like HicB family nuclease